MSPVAMLVALVTLAYLGGFLVGGRTIRGFGLPSSAEYLILGVVLGPAVLGVIGRGLLETFAPIAQVALAWPALVVGVDYGRFRDRDIPPSRIALSAAFGIFTALVIAAAACAVASRVLTGRELLLLSGGTGVACSETTRHVVRWAIERRGARGPLADLFADLAETDDAVPLISMAALFALAPQDGLHPAIAAPAAAFGATLALGLVMGAIAAVLLAGPSFDAAEAWAVLLGTSLVAIGLAVKLGLSSLSVAFVLGLVLRALSRHAGELRALTARAEHPVVLPALLLGGAHVDWGAAGVLAAVAVVAVPARLLAKLAIGAALARLFSAARPAGPLLGAGLASTGALAMGIGLAFALRVPGPVGAAVLLSAAVATVTGEMIGPLALQRALRRAGETSADAGSLPPERASA